MRPSNGPDLPSTSCHVSDPRPVEPQRASLREARHLRQADLPYGAASRADYAVFHADRHDADYFVQAVFTSAEAAQALEDAERFLAAARGLLAGE